MQHHAFGKTLNDMKTKNLLTIVIFLSTVTSVLAQQKVSESGLAYELLTEGTEEVPHENRLMLRFVYTAANDSIYWDTRTSERPYMPPKRVFADNPGMIDEIIYSLKVGDSISADLPVGKIFDNVPKGHSAEEVWNVQMKVVGTMTDDEYRAYRKQLIIDMRPDDDKDGMKQLTKDISLIEDYLKERNIEAVKTESGLFYSIQKKGLGENVRKGDTIRTNYTGYLLSTEFYFDTSVEKVAKANNLYDPGRTYEPLKTAIGVGSVIDGWDEAFQLFNVGTTATIYIPSMHAYGPRKLSDDIPANSIMIFEVELVEIIRKD